MRKQVRQNTALGMSKETERNRKREERLRVREKKRDSINAAPEIQYTESKEQRHSTNFHEKYYLTSTFSFSFKFGLVSDSLGGSLTVANGTQRSGCQLKCEQYYLLQLPHTDYTFISQNHVTTLRRPSCHVHK